MSDYQKKLDQTLRDATVAWFNGMSKEELLQFLADRKDVTADFLRKMIAEQNIVFVMGVTYDVNGSDAVVAFNDADASREEGETAEE